MGNAHSSKDKDKNVKSPGGADLSLLLPASLKDSPQNNALTFEGKKQTPSRLSPPSKLVYQGSQEEQESYMRTVIEVST